MKRFLIIGLTMTSLVFGTAAMSKKSLLFPDTLQNFDKTLWNVTDPVAPGTIVRMRFERGKIVGAETYSQELATTLPASLWTDGVALNQEITVTDKRKIGLGISLLKMIGVDISASNERNRSTKLEFSDVKVRQPTALLPLIEAIQAVDSAKSKTSSLNNLMSMINDQNTPEIIKTPAKSRYWIVTKTFTPSTVKWVTSGDKSTTVKVTCTALNGNCGIIDATVGGTASGNASGSNSTLYVVMKPLYVKDGNVRIGNVSDKQSPRLISG